MPEERKGTPVEKWNEVTGDGTKDRAMKDITTDTEGRTLGERFIAIRRATGLNRKEFAEYLGIPYTTMSDWERNQRTTPSYVLALVEFKVKTDFGIDTKALGSQMRGIEDMVEQNDNSFDGIINNLPNRAVRSEDGVKSQNARKSVLKKLKDCVKLLEGEKEKRQRTTRCEMERC